MTIAATDIFEFYKIIKIIADKFYTPSSTICVDLDKIMNLSDIDYFVLNHGDLLRDHTIVYYARYCMIKGIIRPTTYEFICQVYNLSKFEE